MKLEERAFDDDYWAHDLPIASATILMKKHLKRRLSKVRRGETKKIINKYLKENEDESELSRA